MAAQVDPDRLAEPQADIRLVDILTLRNRFDHYLREAARERKRGRYDSEESLRNEASDLAVQIIATQARFINTEVTCLTQIDCPLCGVEVTLVSSATLSLALRQHVNWVCKQSPNILRAENERLTATLEQWVADAHFSE